MASSSQEKASLLGNYNPFDDEDEEDEDHEDSSSNAADVYASNEKLSRVKGQVNEVVAVMHTNIEKVLQRGEKLEDIQDKTEDLSSDAMLFRQRSKQIRRRMWWNNAKMNIILASLCVIVLLVIILAIYFKNRS